MSAIFDSPTILSRIGLSVLAMVSEMSSYHIFSKNNDLQFEISLWSFSTLGIDTIIPNLSDIGISQTSKI